MQPVEITGILSPWEPRIFSLSVYGILVLVFIASQLFIAYWLGEKKNNPEKSGKDSFKKHDEVMKKFRHSHPEINVVHAKDILTADGNLLAPVKKVSLTGNIQN